MSKNNLFVCILWLFFVLSSSQKTVYVSISFNSVSKVDGVEQTFRADFYLTAFWIDNQVNYTLGYDPDVDFNPNLEFANSNGEVTPQIDSPYSDESNPPSEDVFGGPAPEGTWVSMDQRYIGDFNTKLDLTNFPFDGQDVVLWIESALFAIDNVVILGVDNLSEKMIPRTEEGNYDLEVLEWDLIGTVVKSSEKYYVSFDETYSRLEVNIKLQRQSQYYLWKIILGSILLVIMCICTFMLEVEEPDRMMGTITVFLALISFLFVAGTSIPKVAYQTRLDNFMNFSFFIVFFILLAHTVNYLFRDYEDYLEPDETNQIEMKENETKEERKKRKKRARGFLGLKHLKLSRKLDISFAILFAIIYLVGCLSILVSRT